MSVAAHVKQRAACTSAERLDIPAIAIPACKFGCDALYEAGYVMVDEKGQLLVRELAAVVALTFLPACTCLSEEHPD
jgi:hypothetical protein